MNGWYPDTESVLIPLSCRSSLTTDSKIRLLMVNKWFHKSQMSSTPHISKEKKERKGCCVNNAKTIRIYSAWINHVYNNLIANDLWSNYSTPRHSTCSSVSQVDQKLQYDSAFTENEPSKEDRSYSYLLHPMSPKPCLPLAAPFEELILLLMLSISCHTQPWQPSLYP